jgi:hypothetical protein
MKSMRAPTSTPWARLRHRHGVVDVAGHRVLPHSKLDGGGLAPGHLDRARVDAEAADGLGQAVVASQD